ncbi:MAG TPA: DUF362 domain-containing protein [Candidatus Sulfotelmatobacter sp.]|nr:DUF362 domain-containing protein [Candidatus Sulfotelmatobacter sp.]
MRKSMTRRDWLVLSGLAAGAITARPAQAVSDEARPDEKARALPASPADPVSVAKVRSYDEDLTARFRQMFDQIGGIDNQVKGKTVGIKLNLTGGGPFPGYTVGDTHWVHPRLVGAAVAAFGALGAKRIRILEGAESHKRGYKLEDKLLSGGWDVSAIRNAAPLVEFEDTDAPGQAKQFSLLKVQSKPYVFPAFHMNHSYEDCDFFVSMGKMKNHEEMGLTLCIKNLFGITPLGVYGDREKVFHYGQVQAPSGAPVELDPASNRYEGWRLPRILVDILGARPVDLAIADGITAMVGGEGPWVLGSKPCHPGILVVGRNCVNTDTVAAATMGYNPRAGRHEAPYRVYKNPKNHPFEQCHPTDETFQYADNMMLLAEAAGLGSADLTKIDVRGVPIKEAMFEYEVFWKNQMPKEKS